MPPNPPALTLRTDPLFPRHRTLALAAARYLPAAALAHDALHIERVYRWACRLAVEEGASQDLAGAAALVHDAVAIPKDAPDRPLASERSAQLAATLLPEAGYTDGECADIIEAVRTCSWSRGWQASSALGRIVQDADRLDALGVSGLLRSAACAQEMAERSAGTLYDGNDPVAEKGRELNDRQAMLDHLAIKLLQLVDGFHTATAKAEGLRRHRMLLVMRDELLRELAGIHPLPQGNYQALLLDFDGTLIDSADAIVSCLRHAALRVGFGLSDDEAALRALIGSPLANSLASWGLSPAQVKQAVAAYREAWFGGERDRCKPFPGVIATLQGARAAGCRLVIASAKADQGLADAVERVGLAELVDACFGAHDHESDKRGLVQRAAAHCSGLEMAMVGDRCFDGEAAKANGIDFLAAAYGYGSRSELATCQPQTWLGHPTDLLQVIARG